MSDDPVVKKKIGGKRILIHQSHLLPTYLDRFPFYDRALPRICQSIHDTDKHLTLIDIGSNIGDSIVLITDKVSGSFLCIEGDPKYLPLLKTNTSRLIHSQIEIAPYYCGDNNNSSFSNINQNGTARLVKTNFTSTITLKTLDTIIKLHPNFKKANILKIDTDGFEINILRGATKILSYAKPVVYFEFTPKLYQDLGQNPHEAINILIDHGYHQGLFYDNFGKPVSIVNLHDHATIDYLINQIDNKFIYYYDILTYHHSLTKYQNLFNQELLNHSIATFDSFEFYKQQIDKNETSLKQFNQKIKLLSRQLSLQKTTTTKLKSSLKTITHERNNLKDSLKTTTTKLKSSLKTITHERNNLKDSLQKIYQSKGWKLLSLLYQIKYRLGL